MRLDDMKAALIVGAGDGLSASLARKLGAAGLKIGLAARNTGKLASLADQTGAHTFACDAAKPHDVDRLFADAAGRIGVPDIVIYNASARSRGPVADLVPAEVEQVLAVSAFGGFLVGRAAARAMLPRGSGVILFTGASASLKGYAESAPFAMGKFALRGLAQSMARELGPKGIHVAHVVIDGAIRGARKPESSDQPDSLLDPDAIADSYLHLASQPRNAWTFELEVRPFVERF